MSMWNYLEGSGLALLGLKNAGKSTLLHMLKDDGMTPHVPALQPTPEELSIGGIRLGAFDLGGHRQARRVWEDIFPSLVGIVFMVDTSDRDRFAEAKAELNSLLADEPLFHVPILVLGNKMNSPAAASEDEIRQLLGLPKLTTDEGGVASHREGRPVELFMCSALKGQGYAEGFRWMAEYI